MAETENFRWSIRHDRTVIALLEEDSIQEAALTARVSRHAITRWLKHPVFRARLDKAREELFTAAKARLMGASSEAVGTFQAVMRDEKAPYTARVNAARAIISACLKIRELELAEVLDRLENGEDDTLLGGEVVQ